MDVAQDLVLPQRSASADDGASSVASPDDIRLHAFAVYIRQQHEYIESLQQLLVDAGYAPPSNVDILSSHETQEAISNLVSGRGAKSGSATRVKPEKVDEDVKHERQVKDSLVEDKKSSSSSSSSSSGSRKEDQKEVAEESVALEEHLSTPKEHVSAPKERVSAPKDRVSAPKEHVSTPKEHVSAPKEHVSHLKDPKSDGTRSLRSRVSTPADAPLNNTLTSHVSQISHRSVPTESNVHPRTKPSPPVTPAEDPGKLPLSRTSTMCSTPATPQEEPHEKSAPPRPKAKDTLKTEIEQPVTSSPRAYKTPRKPLRNHESPAMLEPAPAFETNTTVYNKVRPNTLSTPTFPMTPQTPLPPTHDEMVNTATAKPMPPPFARQIESGSPVPQCWCYLKAPPAMPGAPPLYKKRLLKIEGEVLTFSSMNGGKLTPLEAVPVQDLRTFAGYSDASQVMSLGVSFYLCTRSKAWIGIACDGDVLSEWLAWAANQSDISVAPVSMPLPVEPNFLTVSPQRYSKPHSPTHV
eukprot:TRINITY_DN20113_c0_g1_i1.p1 TRINITY_DN20113_c0_g1~~TRINITY_DN20113_c0_g1_i1.p1  ORF type:complete len:533 (+),score=37.29 TRINITY_DN20113_c0_g1_i1:35-1600(+)